MSCKKDEPVPYCQQYPEECVEIESVKDYMYFDVGTWWLYEEETSLEKDCVYVTEANNASGIYGYEMKTKNTLSDYTLHYWPRYFDNNNDCVESGLIYEKCLNIYRSKYKPGDFVAESYCFFYLLNEGDFIYTSSGGAPYYTDNRLSVDKKLDYFQNTYFSFGQTYIISEEHTAIENKQPTNHFYSKNIGLVKKELIDSNEVWNLIDYNIVQ